MQVFATGKAIAVDKTLPKRTVLFKVWRIMKLTAILLFIGSIQVRAHGMSQNGITFSEKDGSLDKVFTAIKKQTSCFEINNDVFTKRGKKITINNRSAPGQKVLNTCFKDQAVHFNIEGKIIIVVTKIEANCRNCHIKRS